VSGQQFVKVDACFLCQRPSGQAILCLDPRDQSEETIHICTSCFWTCCDGNDQNVAQLWSSIKEGESSGYTDAGFIHYLITSLKAFDGYCFLALITSQVYGNPLDQAYLCAAAAHPHFPATWIITVSKNPVFPALEKAAMKTLEVKTIPQEVAYHGRSFVQVREELLADSVKATAIITSFEHYTGTHDVFQLLAHKETAVGYEVIRRHLIG
jgi:hypothetical protein